MMIGAANISPDTKLVVGTGAVSRYKLSQSQKFVMVQYFNCVQMRVSGCSGHYESVLGAGTNCKKCDKQLTFIVRVSTSKVISHLSWRKESKLLQNRFKKSPSTISKLTPLLVFERCELRLSETT
jgi:hypothetical protein